jgi:hypothetical protein
MCCIDDYIYKYIYENRFLSNNYSIYKYRKESLAIKKCKKAPKWQYNMRC